MDEAHASELNKAREPFNPEVVRLSYRLAKSLIESRERLEATLEYLRGYLNNSRDVRLPATQMYNRLTGEYFDSATPDKPLLGDEDAAPEV